MTLNSEPKISIEEEEKVPSIQVKKDDSISFKNLGQNSRRAYLGELRKVIENADIVLHVLDARDPLGTRSTSIEEMTLSNYRKKLVYVLNKADLVPRDVLAGWLKYFRKLHPTIPFKCNTQSQKSNLGSSSGKVIRKFDTSSTSNSESNAVKGNRALGAEELLGLLKNYCRNGDIKSIISVGIVGYPNVGKSSLINSLMRTRAVAVSSTPGFTRAMQEIILDKNIRLLDSPGIVFADGDSAATALRNCVNVEEMEDTITPIQAILTKCPQQYLMQLYSIPSFNPEDSTSFLALVARANGKLKKGGIPNIDAAAKLVLHDWNDGKIKYYCKPPKSVSGGGAGEGDSMILSSFTDTLDVDGLKEEDIRILDAIDSNNEFQNLSTEFIPIDNISSDEKMMEEEEEGEDEDDTENSTSAMMTNTIKSWKNNTKRNNKEIINIDTKKLKKPLRKQKLKADMSASTINTRNSVSGNENYDFDQDFEYNAS